MPAEELDELLVAVGHHDDVLARIRQREVHGFLLGRLRIVGRNDGRAIGRSLREAPAGIRNPGSQPGQLHDDTREPNDGREHSRHQEEPHILSLHHLCTRTIEIDHPTEGVVSGLAFTDSMHPCI